MDRRDFVPAYMLRRGGYGDPPRYRSSQPGMRYPVLKRTGSQGGTFSAASADWSHFCHAAWL